MNRMVRKKPLVLVTRKLPEAIETRMCELFDTRLNVDDKPMPRSALLEAVQGAEVIVPTVTDRLDAELIAAAGPQLRLIANFGTGVDNIDVTAALARGITVTNTPGVLTEDTADMTMALILAVARRLVEGAQIIPAGQWSGWSPTWMLGRRITGKRSASLGLAGSGRRWPTGRRRSGCKSIITTGGRCLPVSKRHWKQLIGNRSTRCSRGWTSSPSIVRTRPRHITCCPRADSNICARMQSS